MQGTRKFQYSTQSVWPEETHIPLRLTRQEYSYYLLASLLVPIDDNLGSFHSLHLLSGCRSTYLHQGIQGSGFTQYQISRWHCSSHTSIRLSRLSQKKPQTIWDRKWFLFRELSGAATENAYLGIMSRLCLVGVNGRCSCYSNCGQWIYTATAFVRGGNFHSLIAVGVVPDTKCNRLRIKCSTETIKDFLNNVI